MWLWVLVVSLLALIWGGTYLLRLAEVEFSLGWPIALTLLVIAGAAAVLVVRRLRANARAKALERELMKQGEQQVADARPERRAEIMELQRQMVEGLAALKRSRLGALHGSRVLYVLPWYAIIGPPGAGKTTALRHSGLEFPFLGPNAAGLKGAGGTRNCDWWFTSEAILLDTAGRYSTEDNDLSEWLAFLGMLKKNRPNTPLNGLIVAVPLPELIQASEPQLAEIAKRLRARIDEIMNTLETMLPVYLMVTKADLVSGFVEFWGDLRRTEREQVFGATLPVGTTIENPTRTFYGEFDLLISRLHARALQHVSSVRQVAVRQKVLQYPVELSSVREALGELVGQLFRHNPYQESPIFRGFYFTSGTQEGRPIDRLVGGMARAFGLVLPAPPEPTESKSYFVTDLLRQVIFPDQFLVGKTAQGKRRERIMGISYLAASIVLALLFLVPPGCSFQKNVALMGDTKQAAVTASAVRWGDQAPVRPKSQGLEPARARVVELRSHRDEGAPLGLRWGMYIGDELYPSLRDAYVERVAAGVVAPTWRSLESKLLNTASLTNMLPAEYGVRFNQLKLYLMLSEPARVDVEWAAPRLIDDWMKSGPGLEGGESALPHAELYLQLLKDGEVAPFKPDAGLISRVRTVLLRAPQLERLYETLVQDASQNIPPITRESIFFGSVAPYVTSTKNLKVDGAYTKRGWDRVRVLLGSERSRLTSERWVLGETAERAESDVDAQVERLRDLYFTRFRNAWRDFIMDMEVARPTNAVEALAELQALAEPEWAYLRLIRTLNDNVTLDVGSAPSALETTVTEKVKQKVEQKLKIDAGADAPPPKRPMSPVEKAFAPLTRFAVPPPEAKEGAPTGLSQYQEVLAKLVGVLTDLRDAQPSSDTSESAREFQTAFRAASALLTTQDGFTRPLLSPYLMRPITAAWAGVVSDSGGAAEGMWEISVWERWHAALEKRYPFVANSPEDARIEDFTEFFHPEKGLLWSYYQQNLKGSLSRTGNNFVPARRFEASVAFAGDFLSNCLSRGAEITDATFSAGAEQPAVKFYVNLHSVSEDVSEVSLEIDGVAQTYKNTPQEWLATQWPALEPQSRGAKVRIRGFSGLDETINRPGDFGFFRLLDAADEVVEGKAAGKPGGVRTLVATWKLKSRPSFIKLDVRAERSQAATSSAVFGGYDCPRKIVVAAGGG